MKNIVSLLFIFPFIYSCNNPCHLNDRESPEDIGLYFTSLTGNVYGTTYNIQFCGITNENFSKEIDSILNEIDNSMSTYKPNSIISKLNKNQEPKIDYHFKNVFNSSKIIYKETNGRFDPSIGLLVNYWGFGPEKFNIESDFKDDKLPYLLQKIGFDKFEIIDDNVKRPFDSYLDFNALAKGYAVDQIGNFLRNQKIENYLVEIGGEITASGLNMNKNKPWVVAIDMPRFDGDRSIYSTIEINNTSLASSGTYRKFKIDSMGNRYAHIIDPFSGYPSRTNILSVTVKSPLCIDADAYATALHTMTLHEIKDFFNNNPNISSLVIFENDNNELEELELNGFY